MSYTAEQITALRSAIATGALEVRNGNGEMIRYRSLSEMERVLSTMEAAVAGASAPSRQVYPSFMERP